MLAVPKIIEDFQPPDSADSTIFDLLAGAFSMAAGAAAYSPGFAGASGLLAGVFTIAAAGGRENEDLTGTLYDVLDKMFDQTNDALKWTLSTALTGSGDVTKLPNQGTKAGSFTCHTSIAAFPANGRFLFESVSKLLDPTIENGIKYMRQALVARALQSTKNRVFVDVQVASADACSSAGYVWQKEHCYYMVTAAEDLLNSDNSATWEPADANKINKMVDDYGFNLGELYLNACQCTKATGDDLGPVDYSKIPENGALVPCFFGVKCYAGRLEAMPSPIGPSHPGLSMFTQDLTDDMV